MITILSTVSYIFLGSVDGFQGSFVQTRVASGSLVAMSDGLSGMISRHLRVLDFLALSE